MKKKIKKDSIKKDGRGGRRIRSSLLITKEGSAQKELLTAIIKYFGGPAPISRLTRETLERSLTIQSWINWRNDERVPLKFVFRIAKAFKVSPYALNYEELIYALPDGPSWDTAVHSVKFLDKGILDNILELKPPLHK